MPAVWFIGQASKRSVLESDWQRVGITGRPSAVWEQENGWSIPHNQFTQAQLNLLINDPLFIVGAPDGPRIGMPQGVDYDVEATKGWVVEQIVQRLGTGGTIVAEGELGSGGGNAAADVPVGGAANQVLTKLSATDYDVGWKTPATSTGGGGGGTASWPTGGTTGQALVKKSNTTGDVGWGNVSAALPAGSVMYARGDSTAARPTTRTDIMVIFTTTGTVPPANMVPDLDIWMQQP